MFNKQRINGKNFILLRRFENVEKKPKIPKPKNQQKFKSMFVLQIKIKAKYIQYIYKGDLNSKIMITFRVGSMIEWCVRINWFCLLTCQNKWIPPNQYDTQCNHETFSNHKNTKLIPATKLFIRH